MQLPEKTTPKRLLFSGHHLLLLKQGDQYEIPSFDKEADWIDNVSHLQELGLHHGTPCYAAAVNEPIADITGYEWVPLKVAIEHLGMMWFGIASRAYQLINFDKNYQYCGQCGQATLRKPDTPERRCESCNLFFYPRISPSIIVLIRRENQILLARKATFTRGVYGLIAGFVEAGESLEDTLHREVKEEVGISIKNICYFGSQTWPFPDSLMLAFIADYAGGEIEFHDGELDEGGWYDIDNLPGLPSSSFSIASRLIEFAVSDMKKKSFKKTIVGKHNAI